MMSLKFFCFCNCCSFNERVCKSYHPVVLVVGDNHLLDNLLDILGIFLGLAPPLALRGSLLELELDKQGLVHLDNWGVEKGIQEGEFSTFSRNSQTLNSDRSN